MKSNKIFLDLYRDQELCKVDIDKLIIIVTKIIISLKHDYEVQEEEIEKIISGNNIIKFIFTPDVMQFLIEVLFQRLNHIKNSSYFLKKWLIIPHIFNVFPNFKSNDNNYKIYENEAMDRSIELDGDEYINVIDKTIYNQSTGVETQIFYNASKCLPNLFTTKLSQDQYLINLDDPLILEQFSNNTSLIGNNVDIYDFGRFVPTSETYIKLINNMKDPENINNIILKGNYTGTRIENYSKNPDTFELNYPSYNLLWDSMRFHLSKYPHPKIFCLELKSKNSFSEALDNFYVNDYNFKELLDYKNKLESNRRRLSRDELNELSKIKSILEESNGCHTIKGYDDLFMLYQIKSENIKNCYTTDRKLIYDSLIKDNSTNELLDGNVYELILKNVSINEGNRGFNLDKIYERFFKITTPNLEKIKTYTYQNYVNESYNSCQKLPSDAVGDATKIKTMYYNLNCAQKLYGLINKKLEDKKKIISNYHQSLISPYTFENIDPKFVNSENFTLNEEYYVMILEQKRNWCECLTVDDNGLFVKINIYCASLNKDRIYKVKYIHSRDGKYLFNNAKDVDIGGKLNINFIREHQNRIALPRIKKITESLETERLETERLETERLETERLETERLETERLETESMKTSRYFEKNFDIEDPFVDYEDLYDDMYDERVNKAEREYERSQFKNRRKRGELDYYSFREKYLKYKKKYIDLKNKLSRDIAV